MIRRCHLPDHPSPVLGSTTSCLRSAVTRIRFRPDETARGNHIGIRDINMECLDDVEVRPLSEGPKWKFTTNIKHFPLDALHVP
jgi:hypothetical protein